MTERSELVQAKRGRCNRARLRRPMAGSPQWWRNARSCCGPPSSPPPWGNRPVRALQSGVNCGPSRSPTRSSPSPPAPCPFADSLPASKHLQSPTRVLVLCAMELNNTATLSRMAARRAASISRELLEVTMSLSLRFASSAPIPARSPEPCRPCPAHAGRMLNRAFP